MPRISDHISTRSFVSPSTIYDSILHKYETGRNKYDTVLETVRLLMSLFKPLLNYKLWQSYFPFNKPDVLPRPLISHRHLGAPRDISWGLEKLVRAIHSRRKSEGTGASNRFRFMLPTSIPRIPSRIFHLEAQIYPYYYQTYNVVKWGNLIPQEFMVDKR